MRNRIIDIKKAELNVDEPVSLDEVKKHLIITSTDDDDLLTSLITQCRRSIEEYCAISLVPKTVTLIADLCSEWELPYGPVTGIHGVSTRSGNEGSGPGTYTTASGWTTEGEEFLSFTPFGPYGFNPGVPFTGFFQWGPYVTEKQWPINRYKIVYTTGYLPPPDDLVLAIMNEISFRYLRRGESGEFNGMCLNARVIAGPHKRELWF